MDHTLSILSLNNYTDLLLKCRQEFLQLQGCSSHPEYDFILFNIILGMNHIFEWYLKENKISTELKLKCIQKFNPFSTPYDVSGDFKQLYSQFNDFPQLNLYQETIRKLCNKAKHFKKQEIERQGKNYTAVCGGENMQCGNPKAVCGGFDHYLYSVEIEGRDTDLAQVVSVQLNNWSSFVENNV